MPKPPRVVIPTLPHHITHRGNRRSDILTVAEDCRIYLRLLKKHAVQNGVHINAYTLMPNHIHLIAVPDEAESLSSMIQEAHGTFAQLFNAKYGWTGHTWEGRFFSCVLDPAHFSNAIRYVERNSVRAGLVKRAEDYEWSSAAAHCGLRKDLLLSDSLSVDMTENWSLWLEGANPSAIDAYIRAQTMTGYPCGSDLYFQDWENILGRRLIPRPKGRPAKIGK